MPKVTVAKLTDHMNLNPILCRTFRVLVLRYSYCTKTQKSVLDRIECMSSHTVMLILSW